uniref:Uncharacterized protein n=1 Tax=Romanomermis culicivorax TaxID=13658 RepID=A0A915IY83_ROMCU
MLFKDMAVSSAASDKIRRSAATPAPSSGVGGQFQFIKQELADGAAAPFPMAGCPTSATGGPGGRCLYDRQIIMSNNNNNGGGGQTDFACTAASYHEAFAISRTTPGPWSHHHQTATVRHIQQFQSASTSSEILLILILMR